MMMMYTVYIGALVKSRCADRQMLPQGYGWC